MNEIEAIEILKNKIEDAYGYNEIMGGDDADVDEYNKKDIKAYCLAILALQEKAEREGCEYCIDLPKKYKGFGYAELFEQIAVDEVYEISIDVKYCPNCGRKLN